MAVEPEEVTVNWAAEKQGLGQVAWNIIASDAMVSEQYNLSPELVGVAKKYLTNLLTDSLNKLGVAE